MIGRPSTQKLGITLGLPINGPMQLKVLNQITFFDYPIYLNFFEIFGTNWWLIFLIHILSEIWRSKIGYLRRNNQKYVK